MMMNFDKINQLLTKISKINSQHLNMVITNADNGKSLIRFNYNVLRDHELSTIVNALKDSDKNYWYGKVYWNDPKIKLEQINESTLVFEVGVDDFVEIVSKDDSQNFDSKIVDSYSKRLLPLKKETKYVIAHGDYRFEGQLTDKIVDVMPKDNYWFIELGDDEKSDFADCTITYYNAGDLTLKDIFTIDGKLSEKTKIEPVNLWVYDSVGDSIEGRFSLCDYGSGDTMGTSYNCNEDTLYTILKKDGYDPYELFVNSNHYNNGVQIYISDDNGSASIPYSDKMIYNTTLNRPLDTFYHDDYIEFNICAM